MCECAAAVGTGVGFRFRQDDVNLGVQFDGGQLTGYGGCPGWWKPRRRWGCARRWRRACRSGGAAGCGTGWRRWCGSGCSRSRAGTKTGTPPIGGGRTRRSSWRVGACPRASRTWRASRRSPGRRTPSTAGPSSGWPRRWRSGTSASAGAPGCLPASCSTWTGPTTRPTATRKARRPTATPASPCATPCWSSTATPAGGGGAKVRPAGEARSQAGSWPRARRVAFKAESLLKGPNTRFVVTSRTDAPLAVSDRYVDRGAAENRIKDVKNALRGDRLSDHRFRANAFRLLLHAAAYWPLDHLRRWLLAAQAARLQLDTLPLRLVKLGGWIRESTRFTIPDVCVHLSAHHPGLDLRLLLARARRIHSWHW